MSTIEEEIVKLSTNEKILLAEKLWETIEQERIFPLTEKQNELLNERLEAHYANPTDGRSWEDVKSKYKKG
jgi:putative addiction module component (TIGR02574 family)